MINPGQYFSDFKSIYQSLQDLVEIIHLIWREAGQVPGDETTVGLWATC